MIIESNVPVYEEMFRTILQTPHRKVDELLHVHKTQFDRDPNFYGHLAVYAVLQGHCAVRDVNEVFIANMLASQYSEHQEAGYVMFQDLPPYQAARVARYFTGYDEIVKVPSYDDSVVKNEFGMKWEKSKHSKSYPNADLRGKVKALVTVNLPKKSKLREQLMKKGSITDSITSFTVQEYLVHHACLNKRNFKGALRSAVKSFLRYRELNEKMMEGALLRGSKYLKQFYIRTNRVPMNDVNSWVNKFLWNGETQAGTRLHGLRQLQTEKDPVKQAEIIVNNKLPFTSVMSAIVSITPSILIAMVDSMSHQELLQSLGTLKSHGAFDNPDIKTLIDSKLKQAKKGKRVDAMKGAKAAAAVAGLDEETRQIVQEVTDSQMKFHGEIGMRTALLIDKSGSMTDAIEIGKQLGAAIAQSCKKDNPPVTYLFDNMPTLVKWTDKDGDITAKSAWDNKLAMFRANGGTAPAEVIKAMISKKTIVDQMVLVTDEGELNDGDFAAQLKKYEANIGVLPSIVIVRIGRNRTNIMETSLRKVHANVDVLACDTIDSVSIPNLIQLLSKKSVFDLVQEILSLDLPTRADWDSKHLNIKENVNE